MSGIPMHVLTPREDAAALRTIPVVRSPRDEFFSAPVDALVHVPFARTTFGAELTEQCERHLPYAMREWQSQRKDPRRPDTDVILVTATRANTPARYLLHLPLVSNWEEVPSLQRLHAGFVGLAAIAAARGFRSVAFYGLAFPALSGDTLVGYVRSAFAGTRIKLYVFDRETPQLKAH